MFFQPPATCLVPNFTHPLNIGRVMWCLVTPRTHGGGKFVDLIGQNHGLFLGQAAPQAGVNIGCWGPGLFGGAGSFTPNGGTGKATHGSVLGTQTVTNLSIAATMSRDSTANIIPVGWFDSGAAQMGIEWFSNGNVFVLIGNGGFPDTPAAGLGPYRFLIVYDGTQSAAANRLTIYVNGISGTITQGGTANPASYTVTGNFVSGFDLGNGRTGQGRIDDVSVWNRSLTVADAVQDYAEVLNGHYNTLTRASTMRWINGPTGAAPTPYVPNPLTVGLGGRPVVAAFGNVQPGSVVQR
jgi:hypothetical protein